MKTKMIQTFEGQMKMGSWDIANCLRISHNLFTRMIKIYFPNWQKIPKIVKRAPTPGAQIYDFLLDEHEIRFLLVKLLKPKIHEDIKCIIWTIFKIDGSGGSFFGKTEDLLFLLKERIEREDKKNGIIDRHKRKSRKATATSDAPTDNSL